MTKADEGEKNAVSSKLPLRLQDTLQYEDLHTKFASLASRKSTGENECACGKICSTELKSAQCPIRLRDLHYQGLSSCTKTSPALRILHFKSM